MGLQFAGAHLVGQAFVPQLVLEQHGAEHVHAVHAGEQIALSGHHREQVFAQLRLDDGAGQGLGFVASVEQALLGRADLRRDAGLLLDQQVATALVL
ncbi:hypothetical protein D3C76_1440740 [compost metagenome]